MNKRTSNGASGEVWGQIFGRENLFRALKRVETNGGAPGADGMTVRELHPYLKAHWLEIKAALDAERYRPSPVKRVEIPKAVGACDCWGYRQW